MPETFDFDIIIAGAGPTGLALALLLAESGLSIVIVDKQNQSTLESPPYDGREIALTQASWLLLMKMGAAAHINSAHVSRINRALVMNGRSSYALTFSAEDVHETHMGCMVSNHLIRQGLYQAALAHENISFLLEREIIAVYTNNAGAVADLHPIGKLQGKMLIAADSRFSKIRGMMGIAVHRNDFMRTFIVCRIKHSNDLQRTAYEIFSINHTIAILPLENNEASLVLTPPSSQVAPLMDMTADAFVEEVIPDLHQHCGDIMLVSERFSYPLVGIHAERFYKKRFALIGDAAVGMHPVTAHGFNLGLSGAHVLASEMKNGQGKGFYFWDERILSAYERRHKKNNTALSWYECARKTLCKNRSLVTDYSSRFASRGKCAYSSKANYRPQLDRQDGLGVP